MQDSKTEFCMFFVREERILYFFQKSSVKTL